MSLQTGSRVGDYEILKVLGAGGMGKVYQVRNVISDRVEAMKVLLPDLESDPELADRFIREIKVQASLHHPNIAALHTAQRIGNQLVMIMEYVQGVTLDQVLRQGPLPLDRAVTYVGQVLAALSYAHAHGVVHRDIKPANMMLTPDGTVKLMDFGIARLTADRRLTQTGRTVGSLYYMSPEQINGVANLDGRADLYSLGVAFYEMVTGQRPFQGESDYSIMAAHLSAQPVPPIQLDSRLPAALNDIILMAIAKEPEKRFQTADAFRSALLTVLPKQAPSAALKETAAAVPPAPNTQRSLWIMAGALVTLLVLVAAAIQVPKLFQVKAVSTPEAVAAVTHSAPAPSLSAPEPSATVLVQEPATVPAPARAVPATTGPTPTRVQGNSPDYKQTNIAQIREEPRSQAAAPTPATATPTPGVSYQTPPPVVPAPSQAQQSSDPARLAALEKVREEAGQASVRLRTAERSLQRLQAEQSRMGTGIRPDAVQAHDRAVMYLTEATTALQTGDVVAADRYLRTATKALERLEEILGL